MNDIVIFHPPFDPKNNKKPLDYRLTRQTLPSQSTPVGFIVNNTLTILGSEYLFTRDILKWIKENLGVAIPDGYYKDADKGQIVFKLDEKSIKDYQNYALFEFDE